MHKKIIKFTIFLAFVFSGCSFKPDMPLQQYNYKANLDSIELSDKWWMDFKDDTLNELVDFALNNNLDLAMALNNIELARVNLGLNKLEFLPTIIYKGGGNLGASGIDSNPKESYSFSGILDYELDLWGRVRNSVSSKKSSFLATKYDYDTARLSIASSVVSSYFKLLFLKKQEEILKDSLKAYESTLEFRQNQLKAGVISSIVYYQTKSQVDSAKFKLIDIQNQISSTNTALSVLIGRDYDEILYDNVKISDNFDFFVPEIPSGIPSNLLLKRSDIASALERLKASNFLVGVAKASYFPKLSITGIFGYTSSEFDRLFIENANSWNIGGSLVGPLLDFGRTSKRVKIANLEQNASLINYDKVIKNAFSEVRNSLANRKNSILKKEAAQNLVDSQQKVYDLAYQRYNAGYSDHLELLDAQRGLLNAKLNLANANLELLNSVVFVYKAFGGGFVADGDTKEFIKNHMQAIK
ncbi:TolC family protein [Campylobacter sp. FMV-PI01]|uniref:TolC family protein n=1 Tax=Campylobacter portucalensis TaxID=2608384 RepID=A0A6L5WFC1_9BACT|nr:TolC family protein [Campylobacter portucalensis]MSN95728.1 TolC family protein [Campylobacter portucalensis]